jgi:hypothetical protein
VQRGTDRCLPRLDPSTIERRFAAGLKNGRKHAHGRLQVKLFQAAMDGNIAVMIFLAKNWLGMTDRPETVVNVINTGPDGPRPQTGPTVEEQRAAIDKMAREIRREVYRRRREEGEPDDPSATPQDRV